jgi:hypothetical protein
MVGWWHTLRYFKFKNVITMKKFKIISIIAAAVFTFSSCSVNENPVEQRGVGVVPAISDVYPGVFDSNDPQNTYVQFTLGIADADKGKVSEMSVQVSSGSKFERKEILKVTTFPTVVKVALKDVTTALGMNLSDVKLGDDFMIEVVTPVNGKPYYSPAAIKASVVCGYNPTMCSGSYSSAANDWGEGDVTITVDPTDEYILYVSGLAEQEGLTEDAPLKIVIDPTNYSLTAKSVIAISTEEWGPDGTYDNLTIDGKGSINTCDGTITFSSSIYVDQGSFSGNFNFILTKK